MKPMNKSMASNKGSVIAFRPDLLCYRDAAIMAGAGVVTMSAGAWTGFVKTGAVLLVGAGVLAYRWYREGQRRGRGFVVEDEVVAGLQTQCDARGWKLQRDMWFDGLGNLDAVITTDSMVCILEIKSYGGLTIRSGRVVRTNRDATPADKELRQAQSQASRVKALMKSSTRPVLPILWCPKSRKEAGVVHAGVLLANGAVDMMVEIIAEMDSQVSAAGAGKGGR
ncbi:NERD domain-containing protein [Scleromatobacter humisilvae]|uniref:NERD domain-containing protein n=1 Tax=Scleromatobacter humisilvae TaxID=2897159 RepID=A0A9X1YJ43_9BURK|nr:NERD domain-containing protein [Scleromatobacter humisilvae]MCK9687269.1 NERD domain-containing protein [Scleromatobacter humisilvae]